MEEIDRKHLHNMVDEMPEQGLSELAESLTYMLQYYKELESYKPKPERERIFFTTTIKRVVERPSLIIGEDDLW